MILITIKPEIVPASLVAYINKKSHELNVKNDAFMNDTRIKYK